MSVTPRWPPSLAPVVPYREWLQFACALICSLVQQPIPAFAGGGHATASNGTTPCLPQSEIETAEHLFINWFDPIETGLQGSSPRISVLLLCPNVSCHAETDWR